MSVVMDAFESFVGVNVWTMLFAWCNLLVLYLFLKKILFKPMKNMIDSRQKEIDDMYKNASDAETDANTMKASYEEKLSHANEESEEILKTALRRAQLKASRIHERAQEEIELEKKHALSEVKNEVSEMAISIAGAVIGREVSEKEHAEFIDSFIDSVGE